jgi:hypothetical protein
MVIKEGNLCLGRFIGNNTGSTGGDIATFVPLVTTPQEMIDPTVIVMIFKNALGLMAQNHKRIDDYFK